MDILNHLDDSQKSELFEEVTSIIRTASHHAQNLKSQETDETETSDENSIVKIHKTVSFHAIPNDEFKDSQPQESDRTFLIEYFKQLQSKLPEIKQKNQILCAAISEYFHQKKMEKPFYDLTAEETSNYTERYRKSLEEILKLRLQRELFLEAAEEKKKKVLIELDKGMEKKNFHRKEFHEAIESTAKLLEASGHPISEKLINRLVNRFQRVHNEMSKVRFEYIKTQNSLFELLDKDKNLDDLGDGFKVFDFENLKTELQTITSTIDSKNEDLEKLRIRYKTNIQQHQKFQETRMEIEMEIEEKAKILSERKAEEEILLKKVNQMKKRKEILKNELLNLSQKAQLLTKSNLMLQYDKMEDDVNTMKSELLKCEEENQKLEMEVQVYENKMKSLMDQKLAKETKEKKNVELCLYEESLLRKRLKADCLNLVLKAEKDKIFKN